MAAAAPTGAQKESGYAGMVTIELYRQTMQSNTASSRVEAERALG
jgi:hypothetical protein